MDAFTWPTAPVVGPTRVFQSWFEADGSFTVDDPNWGRYTFGHPIWADLARHPAVRRHKAVEQLTLPPHYTPVPGTGHFSRWEHAWGSAVFVYRMAELHGLSELDTLILALRTFVSDLGHTTGSHLGDFIAQSMAGMQNNHDARLRQYLEQVGICDLLRKYGIDPDEVIFPSLHDWIEDSQPKLCVDRLDYGLRQMKRMMSHPLLQHLSHKDFALNGSDLVITDVQKALVLARGFMQVFAEHLCDPVQLLLLALMVEKTKQVFVSGAGRSRIWWSRNPLDLMMCSDPAQQLNMAENDTFGSVLDWLMREISAYERGPGWYERHDRIEAALKGESHQQWRPLPSRHHTLRLILVEGKVEEGLSIEGHALRVGLPALKLRRIDPTVCIAGTYKPLTKWYPSFKEELAGYEALMAQSHIAEVTIGNPQWAAILNAGIATVNAEWPVCLQRPPLSAKELNTLVAEAADMADAYGFVPA